MSHEKFVDAVADIYSNDSSNMLLLDQTDKVVELYTKILDQAIAKQVIAYWKKKKTEYTTPSR
jgi:hypothetical protein